MREDLSPRRVLWMRQGRIGEELAVPDLVRTEGSQSLPRETGAQAGGRSDRKRFAPRHLRGRIQARREVVPALQQLALSVHNPRLGSDVGLHRLLKGLHRLLRVERIPREVEAKAPALIRLGRKRRGRRRGGPRIEHVGTIVLGLALLGPRLRNYPGRLGLLDGVGRRPRWRGLATRGMAPDPDENASEHDHRTGRHHRLPHGVPPSYENRRDGSSPPRRYQERSGAKAVPGPWQ